MPNGATCLGFHLLHLLLLHFLHLLRLPDLVLLRLRFTLRGLLLRLLLQLLQARLAAREPRKARSSQRGPSGLGWPSGVQRSGSSTTVRPNDGLSGLLESWNHCVTPRSSRLWPPKTLYHHHMALQNGCNSRLGHGLWRRLVSSGQSKDSPSKPASIFPFVSKSCDLNKRPKVRPLFAKLEPHLSFQRISTYTDYHYISYSYIQLPT